MLIQPFISMNALWLIILFVVTGCDSRFKTEDVLAQYVTDLDRSKYISISVPEVSLPNGLPSKRYRQNNLSQFDIGLLDFLSLQQCDVGHVVGQKNSILGKVMPNSQRFLYELDIIKAIESCEIKDADLSRKLDTVVNQKRQELPIAFANALFDSAEGEAFFSLSNGFLPMNYSSGSDLELLAALDRFIGLGKVLQSAPNINGNTFENDLKTLMDSEYAGRLLYSLVRITQYLNQVSNALDATDTEVCGTPLNYLRQQFKQHYVEVIQPYMGRIHTSAYGVLPRLNELIEMGNFSNSFREYLEIFLMNSEVGIWRQYQLASQKHARAWTRVFETCSVRIASNTKG
ncbi:DUF3080 domain-containing protein [Marinomonas sp. C2222]|uniref:DUF3080 domain-containing protein n=1 Tax=Marinomonas sargassi TaxID=2984494 RepID=A0ABT2YNT7_9GAMM|nr:DUF3080 domain-containing protein [Marinomonas sargassi]MCV2401548.1 DUF3080 domain-containing protein [Marinomonas sargassi]